MPWVVFALGAALSWGMYGPAIHEGQVRLGSPFRALLCVGLAYFAIGVLVPAVALVSQGELGRGWTMPGFGAATLAGAFGAFGAIFVIYAFRAGGVPTYVMPIVFGLAPVINVIVSVALHPPKTAINPMLWLGIVFVAIGASLVLYYKPA
ncbi:MAG: EamA family transporter [Vicinamibacterales bacterium]